MWKINALERNFRNGYDRIGNKLEFGNCKEKYKYYLVLIVGN